MLALWRAGPNSERLREIGARKAHFAVIERRSQLAHLVGVETEDALRVTVRVKVTAFRSTHRCDAPSEVASDLSPRHR
jgi:hypothetical protein